MTNRLAEESSPYLQQHKDNPVDWWPYSEEAFEQARAENKPVFLSIGYSTCHWCHVMARESFSDSKTAEYLNQHFISIKMDREEYPGIDKAYQEMFQMIHQRGGGWPLSVWAHPDGTPFYIGTYFPNTSKHGLPSFMEVNRQLVDAWNNNKNLLDQQAGRLANAMKSLSKNWSIKEGELNEEIYYKEIISLQQRFDIQFGGIGGAPKFPRISSFRLLLQESQYKDLKEITDFVRFTFHQMAKGGIYDQLGGGFARYSVDRKWLVPHFEKMLYDNGALIELGAEIAAITNDDFISFIVRDTISWLAREMTSESGAFYSAINAESEGREGKFYVWEDREFDQILGGDSPLAKARYGVTPKGNFEDPHHPEIKGMNILSVNKSIADLSEQFQIEADELVEKLGSIRKMLFDKRAERVPPSVDTKILTSWNGIAIKGLFRAAELLNFPEAAKLAKSALDYLIKHHLEQDQLLRTYNREKNHRVPGILDDYSFLLSSCISAYEYYNVWEYIEIALKLEKLVTKKFYDPEERVYYINAVDSEDLFSGMIQVSDDSMASGLGNLIGALFKLGKYAENRDLISRAEELIVKLTGRVLDYPGAMDAFLISASPYIRYPHEIVIINAKDTDLDTSFFTSYIPNRLIYRWNNESDGRPTWEVLEGRLSTSKPTVFICKGQTCSLPLHNPQSVSEELAGE